jgi:phosphatidylglycerophosphate synthase
MNAKIPVYLLAPNPRRILGSTLSELTAVAARRAGLELVGTPPTTGEVIVVDPAAAISAEALATLAKAPRIAHGRPLVDFRRLVARVDAELLAQRRVTTVDALLLGAVELIDVPAAPYRGRLDLSRAESVLLRGATKQLLSGDYMGALNRELTLPLVKPFARANIKPNTVTLLGFVATIAAFFPLAHGGYGWLLLGGFVQWIGSLLDGVDGKLARLKGQTTPFGSRLDHRLDVVYYVVLFVGLAIGLARTISGPLLIGLTAVLVVGLLVEIAVEEHMRRTLVPSEHPERFGPMIYRLIDENRSDPVFAFARATIRVTTRAGLPHIFLAAAIVGALPLLFAAAAIASHATWVIALRLLRVATARPVVSHAA